jgi:hypothetical protein
MPQVPNSIAIDTGKTLTIWNVESDDDKEKSSVQLPLMENVVGIAWNHNGQVLAVCHDRKSSDGRERCISLISTRNGRILSDIFNDSLKGCQSLNFAGRSRLLCCCCSAATTDVTTDISARPKTLGEYVCVWDLKRNVEARRFDVDRTTSLLASSLDGTDTYVFVLTSSKFNVFLLKESKQIAQLECKKNSIFTCYDTITTLEQQCLIAIGDDSGTVRIYNLKDFITHSNESQATPVRPTAKFAFDGRSTANRKTASSRTQLTADTKISKCLQLSFSDVVVGLLTSDRLIVYNWLNQVIVGDIRLSTIYTETSANLFAWNGSTVAFAFSKEVVLMDWKTRQQLAKFDFGQSEQNLNSIPGFLSFSPINIEQRQVLSIQRRSLNTASGSVDNDMENTGHQTESIKNDEVMTLNAQLNHDFEEEKLHESSMLTGSLAVSRDIPDGNATNSNLYPYFAGAPNTEEEKKQSDLSIGTNASEDRLVNLIRDEVKEAITCLHSDMIRQFRIQSDEVNKSLSKQLDVMERMADENHRLRLENQRLRDFLRHNESSL